MPLANSEHRGAALGMLFECDICYAAAVLGLVGVVGLLVVLRVNPLA